jgi:Gpi18-like mannosyltransferase
VLSTLVAQVGRSRFLRDDLRIALAPWLVSRAIVILGLMTARFLQDDIKIIPKPIQLAQGLFAWDAAWYRAIAEHGYGINLGETVRFFPLVPILSKGLGFVFLGHEDVALIVIANFSALAFAALLHRLTLVETGDPATAVRAAWFAVILSPAVALVLGYAEATAMALGVGVFLAIRTRRWALAAVLGVLAGLCRPVGVILIAPILIEALTGWRSVVTRERIARVAAVIAPALGMGLYLAYVGIDFGDPFEPFSIQNRATLRGGFEDPVSRLVRAFEDMMGGDRFGSGLHFVWAIVFIVLFVIVLRRLPRSYAVYCGLTIVLGLSASNLDSFERYCVSTFPFVIALAIATRRREVERVVLSLSAAGLFGYSLLAFFGSWVP